MNYLQFSYAYGIDEISYQYIIYIHHHNYNNESNRIYKTAFVQY